MKNPVHGHRSILRRIILTLVGISVIGIIAIVLLASRIYSTSMMRESYLLVDDNSKQLHAIINERIRNTKSVMYEIATDSTFIGYAQVMHDADQDISITRAHMSDRLSTFVHSYDIIRSATFIADNNEYVSYSKWYGSNHEQVWWNQEERSRIYSLYQDNGGVSYITILNLSNVTGRSDPCVLLGIRIRDLKTDETYGVLILSLENTFLELDSSVDGNVLQTETEVSFSGDSSGVHTLVVDGDGMILAGEGSDYLGKNIDVYRAEAFEEKELGERIEEIPEIGWRIINLIDAGTLLAPIRRMLMITLLLSALITAVCVLMSYLTSRKYLQNVRQISAGIRGFAGTEAAPIVIEGVSSDDDLYVIVQQFNQMTGRIQHLVQELKDRNEQIRDAAMRQKHAEIKALEAQINPHFLYNTLDTINWMAIDQEQYEISDMLGALGSLLRYSVSNIEVIVLLRAEVEWLKKYTFLQRQRFNNSFDCVYEIDEQVLDFPIYKMLLQPLIENAIVHGFADVKEGGLIRVSACLRSDGRLEIHIRDNGCGLDEATLQRIRAELAGDGTVDSNSIGLSNIIHRLRIYYENDASLAVESTGGEGTEFTLVIPRRE